MAASMAASFNPQAAAEQACKNYRDVTTQLGQLGLDTSVPEAVRAMAEKSVAQTREFYDRSNDALDASVATFEKTFDAAGQGAAAFNRKIIDIAQRNINSGFDLAKSLAGAKNLADIAEVQAAYWRKMFATLTSQAAEVRALSTMVTAAAAEPIKAHVTNGVDEMRKVQTERLWASSEVQRTAQTRGLTKIVSPALARIIEGSLAGTQIEGDAP
ncbi:MAG: phasin family protein [Methyloceanibacter sp.]|nr:phasin family protein [Methyloceanibacter sp.]